MKEGKEPEGERGKETEREEGREGDRGREGERGKGQRERKALINTEEEAQGVNQEVK